MENAKYINRIRRIAGILGRDIPEIWVNKYNGHWWLVSSDGDLPLPNTRDAVTLPEALDAAEAWFAPQIDLPKCSICHCCHGPNVRHHKNERR